MYVKGPVHVRHANVWLRILLRVVGCNLRRGRSSPVVRCFHNIVDAVKQGTAFRHQQRHLQGLLSSTSPTSPCLCCTEDPANHIPCTQVLGYDAQPRRTNELILLLTARCLIGRLIDRVKSCTPQRGPKHPITKNKYCGVRKALEFSGSANAC